MTPTIAYSAPLAPAPGSSAPVVDPDFSGARSLNLESYNWADFFLASISGGTLPEGADATLTGHRRVLLGSETRTASCDGQPQAAVFNGVHPPPTIASRPPQQVGRRFPRHGHGVSEQLAVLGHDAGLPQVGLCAPATAAPEQRLCRTSPEASRFATSAPAHARAHGGGKQLAVGGRASLEQILQF